MNQEVNPMEKDLVCGMEVDPKTATHKSTYQGKTYYFCSPGCKRDFDKEPEKYIHGTPHGMMHGDMNKHSG